MNVNSDSAGIPIISIIGKKNSGKTTLIEGILPIMNAQGWQICTIKHHTHGDFELDVEGKDTYRHYKAGARGVLIASPVKAAYFERLNDEIPPLDYFTKYFPPGTNLLITEGFHLNNYPRIEVSRKEISTELISQDKSLIICVAADYTTSIGVPFFDINAYREITDFLTGFLGKTHNQRAHDSH